MSQWQFRIWLPNDKALDLRYSVISLQTKKFTEKTAGHCDVIDITPRIHEGIEKEQIRHGLISAFVSGSTAALTTIEYEAGLIQDLKELVERLIPSDRRYRHDDRWADDNGFSHPPGRALRSVHRHTDRKSQSLSGNLAASDLARFR